MNHNKKVNPLTHFNNLKAAAIKKAGGEMSKYKKSLKTFQGDVTGSQVASAASNAANSINPANNTNNVNLDNANTPRPRLTDMSAFGVNLNQDMNKGDYGMMRSRNRSAEAASINNSPGSGRMAQSIAGYQKKGGSVKRKRK